MKKLLSLIFIVCLSFVSLNASCIGDWTSAVSSAYSEFESDMDVCDATWTNQGGRNCVRNANASLNSSVNTADQEMSNCVLEE